MLLSDAGEVRPQWYLSSERCIRHLRRTASCIVDAENTAHIERYWTRQREWQTLDVMLRVLLAGTFSESAAKREGFSLVFSCYSSALHLLGPAVMKAYSQEFFHATAISSTFSMILAPLNTRWIWWITIVVISGTSAMCSAEVP
jgi:hypothetical protein